MNTIVSFDAVSFDATVTTGSLHAPIPLVRANRAAVASVIRTVPPVNRHFTPEVGLIAGQDVAGQDMQMSGWQLTGGEGRVDRACVLGFATDPSTDQTVKYNSTFSTRLGPPSCSPPV